MSDWLKGWSLFVVLLERAIYDGVHYGRHFLLLLCGVVG